MKIPYKFIIKITFILKSVSTYLFYICKYKCLTSFLTFKQTSQTKDDSNIIREIQL